MTAAGRRLQTVCYAAAVEICGRSTNFSTSDCGTGKRKGSSDYHARQEHLPGSTVLSKFLTCK